MPNTRTVSKSSALDSRALADLQGSLTNKQGQLLQLYEHDVRVGKESKHSANDDIVDRANTAYHREFMFSLSVGERRMLIQVEEALKRLEDGDYGHCGHCGVQIGLARLKALPWARYCIDCQELKEKGQLHDF